jgi:hypothetical protein
MIGPFCNDQGLTNSCVPQYLGNNMSESFCERVFSGESPQCHPMLCCACAVLCCAALRCAALCGAVLCGAVLRCAALRCAALRCTALHCAVLCRAVLCCAVTLLVALN